MTPTDCLTCGWPRWDHPPDLKCPSQRPDGSKTPLLGLFPSTFRASGRYVNGVAQPHED